MQSATAQHDQIDPFGTDELPPGTTLLHKQYTIEKFLSSGGFGITYLARDSLNRRVVIKECFPHALCRRSGLTVVARTRSRKEELSSIVRQFVREAWALSKLKHPNILSVHQIFEGNDTAYMVVDYVDGFDLAQSIDDPKLRLSPKDVCEILQKLLGAISLIHDQDMLHRDISPDNILIDRETLNPFLIDFGAAREDVSKGGRTLSEVRVVKDGYSPEEFYANGSQGPFSDLYALAATFYHVIRGEAPPISQSRLFAVATQQADPYAPLDLSMEGYKPSFIAAINKSLQVLPRDRLQSAREWLEIIVSDVDDPAKVIQVPSSERGSDAMSGEERRYPKRPLKSAPVAQADTQTKSKAPLLASIAVLAVLGGAAIMFVLAPSNEIAATPASTPIPAPDTVAAAAPQGESPPDGALQSTAEATSTPAETPIDGLPPPATDLASDAAVPETAPEAMDAAAPTVVLPDWVETLPPASSDLVAASEDFVADDGAPSEEVAVAEAATEALVLPEGVELITPAPATDDTLAVPDAVEVATLEPIVDAPADTDLVLPEGVELIKPAALDTTSAQLSPVSEPVPEAESPEVVSASEDGLLAAPLSTELALNAVTESFGLFLPFINDGTDATRIAGVMEGAEDWMSVGLRIVEVNGNPIEAFADIPGMLQEPLSAATGARANSVPVAFGVEAFAGAEIIRKPFDLQIVPQLSVADKITAQILTKDGEKYAVVSAIAPGVETELMVGDTLLAYMAADGQVDLSDNLRTVLMQQIALGNRTLNFMVERNGAVWLASLKIDLNG